MTGAPVPPDVAVFDLDGTLTLHDTSLPFLRSVAGAWRVRRAAPAVWGAGLPDLVRSWRAERAGPPLGGVRGRWEGLLHERFVRRTLTGREAASLREAGEIFAAGVIRDNLRPDARARIASHRAEGHRLLLASASLDVYVEPLRDLLGFDDVVATRLEFHGGLATGRFDGLPCWGLEKLRRVRAALAPGVEIAFAYGDSPGDAPLLGAARHGTWVR